jgi:hypothetical protein
MKSSIGIAALSIFLLASCAQMAAPPETLKQCDKPKDTKITVQDGVNPVVDQDPINVCAKNVKLTWYIDPSQRSLYEFRADSIVIHYDDGEFSNCKGKSNGGEIDPGNKDKIKCHDKNDKHGTAPKRKYKYDINIYAVGSPDNAPPVAQYDPIIAND